MALLNHKMLRRSPLTPPCVWHTSGCDTDSHPQRLLWGSGYQLPLSSALIPHAHWRRTKGGREENGIGNSEKIEWHKETSDEKYCGILDRLKKDELFHFKDDSLFFSFCSRPLMQAEKSFTWWWKTESIRAVPPLMKYPTTANNAATKLTFYKNTVNWTFASEPLSFSFIFK